MSKSGSRKKNIPKSPGDRVYYRARITKLATSVLEDRDLAEKWLNEPQFGLDEKIPIEMMKTKEGAKEVEELLYRIEYGVIS